MPTGRVGRHVEADYQWRRVLTLDPDERIKADVTTKIASGLGPKRPEAAPARRQHLDACRERRSLRRSEDQPVPTRRRPGGGRLSPAVQPHGFRRRGRPRQRL